jgi:hypothetical protein
MKTKKEIMGYINATKGDYLINSNTSYSKINKSKEVWWFNVRNDKFSNDVHLLLNAENKVIWITLPNGFVSNLGSIFKTRNDKDAVDLEISADKHFRYLHDVKSGGTGFDFTPYVKETIVH